MNSSDTSPALDTNRPIHEVLPAGELLAALRALKRGDFTVRLPLDRSGMAGAICEAFNDGAELNGRLVSELQRVSAVVGKDGRLDQRARAGEAGGGWRSCADAVNDLIDDLVRPTTEVGRVIGAVASGDLSRKMLTEVDERPLKGEFLRTARLVNGMVDQLGSFASEVTRVAREVGTEGNLGGQAQVKGTGGIWNDLIENVNSMASNLTAQVRNIAEVTTAVATGDLSKKITVDVKGEILELKATINTMVDQLNSFAAEVTRVAREVGTEGKLGGQAEVPGVGGTWKDLTDSVNSMASNLTAQVRNIAEVTTAVANGDLSKKIAVDVKGEILELKITINTMVDQLNAFAAEVTRVAREVGTEGKLGGQAQVRGVAGTWKDLTDNVNSMASNLTAQVRGIAKVVTAVANGDLKRKLALEAHGEIAELAETINGMTDTLATFAEQVTTVAREVGVEGQLGGQAKVPGAAGTWRDLTDNVNQLAGNLTTQVRAIGDVATAVTKGDLTRSIALDASGEMAALKDNMNEMIRNLRETTQKTTEQDWLKTNLARFTRMLQGQRDLVTVGQQILSELAPLVDMQHGVFYIAERDETGAKVLKLLASYAYVERASVPLRFRMGEGLVGQCAFEKRKIILTTVPSDYIRIASGLGEAKPRTIMVLPVLFEEKINAVIELASFSELSEIHRTFLDQLTESIGIVINTIAAGMRTESLLAQSQSLTLELQSQQEELRETNERLEHQAMTLRQSEDRLKHQQEELRQTNDQLGEKATLLELKNREVEFAKQEIEEKAEQLALTSKYKSEFLANMSHELRTPLNSLLILSRMLSENPEGNLSEKQVEFASTIHGSGADLLALINDILDLSKIESGTITVDATEVPFRDLRDYVEQNFRHVAQQKHLEFAVQLGAGLPRAFVTDPKRLQQILKNLLSNAFKFTERGHVTLAMDAVVDGWSRENEALTDADMVLAFSVHDTGIGIPHDKQRIIFEAFQQADGTTSRRYGGTGLGLSISRELSRLLGGEIRVTSAPGDGSTFTLFLPRTYVQSAPPVRHDGYDPLPRLNVQSAPTPHATNVSDVLLRYAQASAKHPRPSAMNEGPPTTVTAMRLAGLDDREQLEPDDSVLLVIEDDINFARVVLDTARTKGFKVVFASDGDDGLALARRLKPAAITLDLRLPDIDGWTVLDQLKHDPSMQHIPVVVVSADDQRRRGLKMGAFDYLQKPISLDEVTGALGELVGFIEAPRKAVLVVAPDDAVRERIVATLTVPEIVVVAVASSEEALAQLVAPSSDVPNDKAYRCVVMGGGLADAVDFVRAVRRHDALADLPMVLSEAAPTTEVTTVSSEEQAAQSARLAQLDRLAVKVVTSLPKLLAETSIFLHLPESEMSEAQRTMLAELQRRTDTLDGARVLVIDDDVRNIFAVTSALERHKASVIFAENGQDGLDMLANNAVDVVLTDIMMPEMDGYEVIRRIRAQARFEKLPVIAVTAKAMQADREKCIQAGASDYIAKPVDMDHLLSILRVWLDR